MDGHQLFAVFSSRKPKHLMEMNLKETNKWQIEKKLKRAAFKQDEQSAQAPIYKDSYLFLEVTES